VLACLYDVHGNLPALDAVLADARARGATSYLLGGDYALFGGWPAETLARLEALEDATWIRGNVDRWVGGEDADVPEDPTPRTAIPDCRAAIGDEAAARLLALPERAELGGDMLAVHASPASDMRSFLPDPADGDAELLAGVAAGRLLFGHTHLQFRRRSGDVELVNPGSVGLPLDGDPRAGYALIDPEGEVELRRVDYDQAAAVQRLHDAFGDAPWVPVTAGRLRNARFDAA
jgi:predicted phosphodiesterase